MGEQKGEKLIDCCSFSKICRRKIVRHCSYTKHMRPLSSLSVVSFWRTLEFAVKLASMYLSLENNGYAFERCIFFKQSLCWRATFRRPAAELLKRSGSWNERSSISRLRRFARSQRQCALSAHFESGSDWAHAKLHCCYLFTFASASQRSIYLAVWTLVGFMPPLWHRHVECTQSGKLYTFVDLFKRSSWSAQWFNARSSSHKRLRQQQQQQQKAATNRNESILERISGNSFARFL